MDKKDIEPEDKVVEDEKEIDTEISTGDEVLLSKGNPLKSSLTATVAELTSRSITLAFSDIPPNWVFDSNIRIDLYVNDITFKRIEKTLDHLFHIKDQRTLHLISIILGSTVPKKTCNNPLWHPLQYQELRLLF